MYTQPHYPNTIYTPPTIYTPIPHANLVHPLPNSISPPPHPHSIYPSVRATRGRWLWIARSPSTSTDSRPGSCA